MATPLRPNFFFWPLPQTHQPPYLVKNERSLISNNYWTRLSKLISWFVSGEQIIYLPKLKAEANNIDLRATDKSQDFGITEFNNCFIIWLPSLFSYFNHFLPAQVSDLPFFSWDLGSNCIWAEYYLQQHTFRRYYAWAVISRSRGGLSASGKEEKKMHRMIIAMIWQMHIYSQPHVIMHTLQPWH